jgi:glycosyltransferase involved in cell wall biosynthesis
MKIMQIVSGEEVNGAVSHCLLLCRQLARRGNQVTVVCRPGATIATDATADAIDVVTSDLHRWPMDELRRIAAVARRRGVEVIHTHMSRAHFFGVLLRYWTGIPCVATAHCRRFQLHWMFNDLVIAVSEATRRFHRRVNLVPSRRIVTVHNFVDQRRIAAVPEGARDRVRSSLGVRRGSPLIGVVGTVCPKKGQVFMVRAMPRVLAAVPDARLVVVGGSQDDYALAAKTEARELGVASAILWTGRRDDVPEIMTALDVCASASLEDNLPLTLLEAMAAGVPVVATAVGGVPECVVDNHTGILVPPRDVRALADAIVRLLRDPRRRRHFADAGRRYVGDHFSLERQSASIEVELERVVTRLGRRSRAA